MEEVDYFGVFLFNGTIQWRFTIILLRINICTVSDQQLDDFLMPVFSRP